MGRGYFFGLLVGGLVSLTSLVCVSLALPLAPFSSGKQVVTAPVSEPEVAATAEAEAESVADAVPDVAAPEAITPEATIASAPEPATSATPEVTIVDVPVGSEFARAKPDVALSLPAPAQAPVASDAPSVSVPQAEPAPDLAEVGTASAPEGTSDVPVVMAAPVDPSPEMPSIIASAVDADGALSGLALPDLGVQIAPDSAATPDVAAAPLPEVTVPQAEDIVATEPVSPTVPDAAPEPETETVVDKPAPEPTPEPEPETIPAPVTEIIVAEPSAPAAEVAVQEPENTSPADTAIVDEAAAEAEENAPTFPTVSGLARQPAIGLETTTEPGFSQSVPGVKINRLPRIGDAAEDAPDSTDEGVADATLLLPGDETSTAFERFAAPFVNEEDKPLVAVVLIDQGEAAGGLDPAALAAIGQPITIAIDPERPDAGARAAVYRLAGHEVVILAPEMPRGATASDLEVAYQSYTRALPEAVALIGTPVSVFQSDRRVAQHMVALLATDGRGLVTYNRGLNPARQAATGAELPHAGVFRALDAEGESGNTIRRYLDRAAFEAARAGTVLVVGGSSSETVAALKDWIADGGKGSVVGPASAAMSE
ncbi:MAG: divergent polysaccharide deacetylase family protein [Albidovulum sp.]